MKNFISRFIKVCPQTGPQLKALKKWTLPLFSLLSLIWVIIRLIPKPQRAAYPCMKVAIPFASSLIIYLTGLLASVVVFKKAFRKVSESKYFIAGLLLVAGLGFSILTIFTSKQDLFAAETESYNYEDPLGPNTPIGEAKGLSPVVLSGCIIPMPPMRTVIRKSSEMAISWIRIVTRCWLMKCFLRQFLM